MAAHIFGAPWRGNMAISIDASGRKTRLVRGTNIAAAAPWTIPATELKALSKAILGHPDVKAQLGKNRSRLLSLQALPVFEKGPPLPKPTRFRATIFDYVKNRTLLVHATQGRKLSVEAESLRSQPLPSDDEFREAEEILRQDPEYGELIKSGK